MQGCCIAIALAARGVGVTLYDRNDRLLSRAAVANEGKIHLGYMYANDPTYATARMMMKGALSFAPFFGRHLGQPVDSLTISLPAAYVVHRDSQRTPEQVFDYLGAVHSLVRDAAGTAPGDYFGQAFSNGLQPWSTAEIESEFDPQVALAAFDTPEVAIDPIQLATVLRERIASDPSIEVRLHHDVLSIDAGDRPSVRSQGPGGPASDRFDHVVNALWDGRLAIDETLGLRPDRPWLHRLKYGVSFRLDTARAPSATFVSGPFGEVVSYADGLTYLTWYPVCLQAVSRDLRPPDWPTYPEEPLRSALITGTLKAMADFVHSLAGLRATDLSDVTVKGGVIVAWGHTDIYDPLSELHRRFEIGVTSSGRVHSVDPGKLTLAPYFAEACANRILEGTRH